MGDRSKNKNSIVGKNIRYLRESYGLTQKELANKIFKSESTVRMWELGNSEPDIETLIMLSKLFEVKIDDLINAQYEHQSSNPIHIPPELQNIQFAFYEGLDGLTDESMQDILKYVKYVKDNQDKK
jgi:transcriptional regulator with XRE-family HTH domain|nr:MAG TPA: hypothetical protein [Siphoviridae sp. ctIwT7]